MIREVETFILKIWRGTPGRQYWEEFELPLCEGENVISALMEIQKHPVNRAGKRVEPVVWEMGCLEEVCGSCSMLINGFPRQACTALVAQLLSEERVVTLAPFTKFPLVRDLIVDRGVMFENLKKVEAWIDEEKSDQCGFGSLISQDKQQLMYALAQCMTCGCCSEACPQTHRGTRFIGPAAIAQVQLFNTHPTGRRKRRARLRSLMGEGGISDCGNAQNCVAVCPKHLPLTDSIAAMSRGVTLQALGDVFHLHD